MAAALLLGYLTQKIGLSPIVGYLLAGLLVGPYTPGFVADRTLADQLAEIGVILLMFGVGLHFQLKDLMAVRRVALVGALIQSLAATALGAVAAHAFGWGWPAGIVFGLALSVASTVVLTRVLSDHGDLHSGTGRIAIGWLVVEDLFTVLVLVLLPALFGGGSHNLWLALALAVGKIAVLGIFTFVVGGRLIPRLLNGIAATHSRELFTLAVLTLALGIAVASAYWFGVSMALGAFLAGMVVGQSEFSQRAAADALPMRDAFAVLFFVSVGMLFDPRQLWQAPAMAVMALGIVLIGKPVAAFLIVTLLGHGSKAALGVSAALAQIGEFSFILAAMGKNLKLLTADAANILVAVSIATIALNPLAYRLTGPAEAYLRRHSRLWGRLNRRREQEGGPPTRAAHRAVVIGYGPIGQTVAHLLVQCGIEPTVIELNLDTVRRLRSEGMQAVYGDAGQRSILESAGVAGAVTLVLSAPATAESAEIIRMAKEIHPGVQVLARSAFHGETETIRAAGATRVFSGEGEVALAMTVYILEQLGGTPEQLDRERARVRAFLAT